ncbi:MAG TPA: hypothetical protein VHB20_01225 [Verrucomicrobiae bacterium]|nr:hypothetical protein [Verrucomicrobiae bacterium]
MDNDDQTAWGHGRKWLTGMALALGFIAFLYVEEDVRGRLTWSQTQDECARQGMDLRWLALVPPPIPEAENIFAAPKMEEWFEGRGRNELTRRIEPSLGSNLVSETYLPTTNRTDAEQYLIATRPFEPELRIMRQGLQRPRARLRGDYGRAVDLPVVNFVAIRAVSRLLVARVHCHLLMGEEAGALDDLALLRDLRRLLGAPPQTLLSAMIDTAISRLYVEAVADGLAAHRWSEPALAGLERDLRGIYLPSHLRQGAVNAARFSVNVLETGAHQGGLVLEGNRLPDRWRWGPHGWFLQNLSWIAQCDRAALRMFDETNRAIHLENAPPAPTPGRPFQILAAIAVPNFLVSARTTARVQTDIFQKEITCALERYRLAKRCYPPDLGALVPSYLERIPNDVLGGKPPRYILGTNDDFELSSAGDGLTNRWAWPPAP